MYPSFQVQSDSLPLKHSNSSSLFESAVVTSSTAIGKMFSCEAPYTANAKDGSLESRNSDKKIRNNGKAREVTSHFDENVSFFDIIIMSEPLTMCCLMSRM